MEELEEEAARTAWNDYILRTVGILELQLPPDQPVSREMMEWWRKQKR